MTGPLYTDNDLLSLTLQHPLFHTDSGPGKKEILLLEDDLLFGPFLKSSLSRQGFVVELLVNGASGLRALSDRKYDFVVCDIDLEGLNGIELYRNLAKKQPLMCQRFIFLSGHPDNEAVAGFILAIQGTILYKPFHIDELLGYLI